MFYLSLIIGLILLLAVYLTSQWEEQQYEGIDEKMSEDDSDVESTEGDDSGLEEPGELWEGTIEGIHATIYRGWQRDIGVVLEREFPFEARVEHANFLRKMTRFFKEIKSHRMNVSSSGRSESLLAYSSDPEPMKQILSAWEAPEPMEFLKDIHHVTFGEEGLRIQFYHPEINLDELTDKAKSSVKLYQALPENIKQSTETIDSD